MTGGSRRSDAPDPKGLAGRRTGDQPAPGERAREICLRLLGDIGIVDDRAFAQAWVTSRHHGRGLAGRTLAGELRRKGVDSGTVDDAVGELDPATQEATARTLVARGLRAESGRAPAAVFRRLVGMLARKGYPAALAYRVVKDALGQHPATAEFADGIDPDAVDGEVTP